jgi:hypothetical protein
MGEQSVDEGNFFLCCLLFSNAGLLKFVYIIEKATSLSLYERAQIYDCVPWKCETCILATLALG